MLPCNCIILHDAPVRANYAIVSIFASEKILYYITAESIAHIIPNKQIILFMAQGYYCFLYLFTRASEMTPFQFIPNAKSYVFPSAST